MILLVAIFRTKILATSLAACIFVEPYYPVTWSLFYVLTQFMLQIYALWVEVTKLGMLLFDVGKSSGFVS